MLVVSLHLLQHLLTVLAGRLTVITQVVAQSDGECHLLIRLTPRCFAVGLVGQQTTDDHGGNHGQIHQLALVVVTIEQATGLPQ